MTDVTAFSPTDVWVFGAPSADYPGLGTWHLKGTTWTKVTGLAGSISTAGALSPTSMWAISSDGTAPDDILVDYNGVTWQRITSTVLNGLQFSGICVKHANDIYALGTEGNGTQHLVHFNGSAMETPDGTVIGPAEGRGTGRLERRVVQRLLSPRRRRRWPSTGPPPGPGRATVLPGSTGQAFGITLISGTTSLWASGTMPDVRGAGRGDLGLRPRRLSPGRAPPPAA